MNAGSYGYCFFQLPLLPVFTGVQETPDPLRGLPARLPFALAADTDSGLVYQHSFADLGPVLRQAYQIGSLLSTPPGADGYARKRADELVSGLHEQVRSFRNLRVLEIGCGTGYVLDALKSEGADCLGCEPGPSGAEARDRYLLRIVPKLFSAVDYQPASFDVVYSSMVLEHVGSAREFLRQQLCLLRSGGMLFVAVPACDALLTSGDPGLPCHEHHYYFTRESLSRLLLEIGCEQVIVRQTTATQSLQATARKGAASMRQAGEVLPGYNPPTQQFAAQFFRRIGALQRRVDNLRGKRLGWCGISLGASVLSGLLDLRDVAVHLFEADGSKIGRYLPGFPEPIHADDELGKIPVDECWFIPATNARRICANLVLRYGIEPNRMICVRDV